MHEFSKKENREIDTELLRKEIRRRKLGSWPTKKLKNK
jgi:hypothetical protein